MPLKTPDALVTLHVAQTHKLWESCWRGHLKCWCCVLRSPFPETEPTKEGEVQGTREENKAPALSVAKVCLTTPVQIETALAYQLCSRQNVAQLIATNC